MNEVLIMVSVLIFVIGAGAVLLLSTISSRGADGPGGDDSLPGAKVPPLH